MGPKKGARRATPTGDGDLDLDPGNDPVSVERAGSGQQAIMTGVWGGSDGKHGATVKVYVEPADNESFAEASKRARKHAVLVYRELMDAMNNL